MATRNKTATEVANDELAKNFNCVYALIERRREKAARVLADADANVWSRKKALGTVLECNNAVKALIAITGGLEDAMSGGFIPAHEYTLGGDD